MKRFFTPKLILILIMILTLQPLLPLATISAEDPSANPNNFEVEDTRAPEGVVTDIPEEPSVQRAYKNFTHQASELRFLTDLLTKNLRFTPTDYEYLQKWATISRVIQALEKTDPAAYQAFVDSGYQTIPPKIVEQYQDLLPLPNYHKWMLEALWRRMSDPELEGFGGEFLDVSRMLADHSSDAQVESTEGEEGKPAEQEKNISSHYWQDVHAADIAAIDYLRCTKVTFKPEGGTSKKLKITKREKLDPVEIQVAWQADGPQTNPLSSYPFGANDTNPNLLTNLFGASFDDLLRRIGTQSVTAELVKILTEGGYRIPDNTLDFITNWEGSTHDIGTILQRLGQIIALGGMGGTTTAPIFPVGQTLDQTIDLIGAHLLTQVFPKLTVTALTSQSLEEVGNKLAREGLGRQILGPGYVVEGATSQELLASLGSQYFTGKILGLRPTNALTQFPLANRAEIEQAVGTLAISQWLSIPLDQLRTADLRTSLGNRFQTQFIDEAEDTDRLLKLPSSSTQAFAANPTAAAFGNLARQVGQILFAGSIDLYVSSDPTVRNRAYNLNLQFGPEDFFIPDPAFYPSSLEQLAEIERFYRPMITDIDWNEFTRRYRALPRPSLPNQPPRPLNRPAEEIANDPDEPLNDIAVIRAWLASHLLIQPDLIGSLSIGPITKNILADVGRQVVVKIDPQPFNQLALLHFLATGQMWKIPAAGTDVQVPVLDPDQTAGDKLGLLAGDFERIWRTNRFTTDILPRLAGDHLADALANEPPEAAFLSGTTRRPIRTDEFLQDSLAKLADSLGDLRRLSPAASAIVTEMKTVIAQVRPEDWEPTLHSPGEQRLETFLDTLGARLPELLRHAGPDTLRPVLNDWAALLAGRPITTPADLQVAPVPIDRSTGLTKSALEKFVREEQSPAAFIAGLGTTFLTGTIWAADNPQKMAADLVRARSRTSDPSYTSFFTSYKTTFEAFARRLNQQQETTGNQALSPEAVFGIFAGKSATPFSRVIGAALYKSWVGQPGSIWNSGQGVAGITAAVGLRQILAGNGFVGRFNPSSGLVDQVLQKIFEQRSGLLWAGAAAALLVKNGKNFPTLLGFPADLKAQFEKLWDPNNPQKVIDSLLKNPAAWQQINPSRVFGSNFGTAGPAIAGALVTMFTGQGEGKNLLTGVRDNIDQYLPRFSRALGVQVDVGPVYRAIKAADEQGAVAAFGAIGGTLIDRRLAGLTTILLSRDKSPQTMVNWATANLPQFMGNAASPAIVGFAAGLGTYFFDNTVTNPKARNDLFRQAAGQLASAAGIPYVADVMKLASDPRSFGLAVMGSLLTSRLGLPQFNYEEVRKALFGADAKTVQQAAADIRTANPSMSEEQIQAAAKKSVGDATNQARKNIQYAVMDMTLRLPPGVSKAIFEGTTNQKLDALFLTAQQYLNLPPEAYLALELVKNKGDITKISDLTFSYLDGRLGELIGLPLPPRFLKNTADFVTGKISDLDYARTLGDFTAGQVSGFMDKKLGLPSGTTYALGQGFSGMIGAQNQLSALTNQRDLLLVRLSGDPTNSTLYDQLNSLDGQIVDAKVGLSQAQGLLAGMAVNMVFGQVFGKAMASIEKSLGLPPGTASFLVNAALTSVFTNTAFMSIMAMNLPFFAATLILGPLLNDLFSGLGLGGLFGGGEEQTLSVCSAGGYYPYIKKEDDEQEGEEGLKARFYDPYGDLDHFRPIEKRVEEKKPADVARALGLWPGYPGEFYGEEVNADAYALGKQTAARWKIRQLLGELLLMRSRYDETQLMPRQLITFAIPEQARGEDGDYLKFYDGHDDSDDRFFVRDASGRAIGLIDWPFFPADETIRSWWKRAGDVWGYGNGLPGSGNAVPQRGDPHERQSLAQIFYGNYNVGLWSEYTQQYHHHVHAGY